MLAAKKRKCRHGLGSRTESDTQPPILASKDRRHDGRLCMWRSSSMNGRWAAARGLPRTEGHRRRVEAFRRVGDRTADELGIKVLDDLHLRPEKTGRARDRKSAILSVAGGGSSATICDPASRRRPGAGDRRPLRAGAGTCARFLNEAEELTRDDTRSSCSWSHSTTDARQEIAQAAAAARPAEGRRGQSAIPPRSTLIPWSIPRCGRMPDPGSDRFAPAESSGCRIS